LVNYYDYSVPCYKIPSLAPKLTYPVQWVQRHLSLAVNVSGRKAMYPPLSSAVTMSAWSCISTRTYAFKACRRINTLHCVFPFFTFVYI